MFARNDTGTIEMARQRLIEDVGDQGGLARARYARHRHEHRQRKLRGDVLQVVGAGTDDPQGAVGIARATPGRHLDPELVAQVSRGQRRRVFEDLVDGALGHHFPTEAAGARTEVDDMISRPDRVLVVLHDDHGVAEVAKALQRAKQPLVVALVQADARLVENVEHAHEPRPDLGCQADALHLAAGERRGAAPQREVVEADVAEEAQAVTHFLEDRAGDVGIEPRYRWPPAHAAGSTRRSRPPGPPTGPPRRQCSCLPPAPRGFPA